MKKLKRLLLTLMCLSIMLAAMPAAIHADQSPALDIKLVNQFQLAWWDKGSGGSHDGAYYKPLVPQGYYAVGYYGQSDYNEAYGQVLAVKANTANAIAYPVDYQLIWTDSGSGADMDGAFWKPVPPSGYTAMGMVVTNGGKPSLSEVACIKNEYVVKGSVGAFVWDDTKTGAHTDFGSWKINPASGGIAAGTFFGITSHTAPADHELLWCFKPEALNFSDTEPVPNNDSGQLALLKKYAPRVWLAQDEEFMPSSVDWAFQYMERYKNDSDGGRYWIRTKQSLSSPSDYTLPVFQGNLQSAQVYAYWVDKNDKVDLVYFFYYPYNRGKELLDTIWGNHAGDWEHITVRLNKITINNNLYLAPEQVYLSQHASGSTYSWSSYTKTAETHPVVYSAWGSHATYKDPGDYEYEDLVVASLVDTCSSGTAWDTWNTVTAFNYSRQVGLNTQWPAWMSTDYTNPGSGDPSVPGNGPIYRWGNESQGGSYFGYYRLEDGPTGPADKGVWTANTIE